MYKIKKIKRKKLAKMLMYCMLIKKSNTVAIDLKIKSLSDGSVSKGLILYRYLLIKHTREIKN